MSVTWQQPVLDRTPSLVVTPAIVGHRGASGHRPEHTLAAYRAAIRMGVDDIEIDLVSTQDGVLVARHEPELSRTTDVAEHLDLADRRVTKTIDGRAVTGWFAEDFMLAEIKMLTARERLPVTRPESAAHDGCDGIATLTEILAMVHAESIRRRRTVGVMIELKHAAYFDSIGLPLDVPLLAALRRHDLDGPMARISLMAFEPAILQRLALRTRLPIIQLLEVGDSHAELCTPEGLAWIDEYADGIGPHKNLVLPRDQSAAIGEPSSLVRDAHRLWLTVHVWTVRAENRYLPSNLRHGDDPDAPGDMAGEVRALLDVGADGVITDHPDRAVSTARELVA
ncbi:glycerophosphodiester phosphodiesterase family protein [Nocardioides sp.]|uniref:glycerophosphodiester phosphodiesterase family protein n=1 Tax=Nocardioides sp. TaxID=35761 RepID=UPI002BAFFA6C|nr:glycerophosphodiester phosphodiesterase family protein [Nocardioides sp.]HXH77040.1 glycerophosphodiester phosphodiesterase family protein [Nocardioides sp.]